MRAVSNIVVEIMVLTVFLAVMPVLFLTTVKTYNDRLSQLEKASVQVAKGLGYSTDAILACTNNYCTVIVKNVRPPGEDYVTLYITCDGYRTYNLSIGGIGMSNSYTWIVNGFPARCIAVIYEPGTGLYYSVGWR